MSIQEFNYNELAERFSEKTKNDIIEWLNFVNYISDTQKEYILKEYKDFLAGIIYDYVKIASQNLCENENLNISSEDVEFICETLVKWTSHKGATLAWLNVPKQYWNTYLSIIAYAIYGTALNVYEKVDKQKFHDIAIIEAEKQWGNILSRLKGDATGDNKEKTEKYKNTPLEGASIIFQNLQDVVSLKDKLNE